MAKRYTDTDKWKKPFMQTLPLEYKTFFLYLLDECDHAGIWHCEFEIANLRLGANLSKERALKLYKDRVFDFDNGNKWFVLDFIQFQYGVLKPENRVHSSVIERLTKYGLEEKIKGLVRGLQSPKDIYKDKDKDKGGEFENSTNPPTLEEVQACFVRQGGSMEQAKVFYDHYSGVGWKSGITPIINYAHFVSKWISRDKNTNPSKVDLTSKYEQLKQRQQNG